MFSGRLYIQSKIVFADFPPYRDLYMIDAVLAKVFGTKNEREVKGMLPTVAAINDLGAGASRALRHRPGR